MDKIQRALRFFRVTDEANNLSVTNLAILAALTNLALNQEFTLEQIGVFVASLIAYQVKRFALPPVTPKQEVEDLRKELESLKTRLSAGTLLRR